MTAIKARGHICFSGALLVAWFLRRARMMAVVVVQGICLGLAAGSLASSPAVAQERPMPSLEGEVSSPPEAQPLVTPSPKRANFLGTPASKDVREAAEWVVDSGDNRGLPFVIIDKVQAKVFVFNNVGQLRGVTLALLGISRGDNTAPDIGSKKLSAISLKDRTTAAGRFVAALGQDLEKEVLWVDYDTSLSLHPVVNGTPHDHRLARLATMSPLDKRISFGCINVPVRFFNEVVLKTFTGTNGIVYILPEIKSMREVFPAYYDVEEHSRLQTVSN